MALRDNLLPVVDLGRSLLQSFGLRQDQCFIVTKTWASGVTGQGPGIETQIEIIPRPKVEDLGGGSFRITKVTPTYTGTTSGGYNITQLIPAQAAGTVTFVRLTGLYGTRECRIVEVVRRSPFELDLHVEDRK